MPKPSRGDALKQLRTLFNLGAIGELTDGQLLERFLDREGEAAELAFAALLERHGPMVLRTCLAVLRDGHEAEDAFQATFQILVRKARGLWVRDSLGPWLHAVALRMARCARSEAARRRRAETRAAESAARTAVDADPEGLGEALHEELGRLPERYRVAVVLCCLEGLSLAQAARRLGWPLGTVQSRLARGRQRLRERLIRRGLAPSAGAFGAALAAERARAAVPTALVESTIRSAMHAAAGSVVAVVPAAVTIRAEEVLSTMYLFKLKATAVALLAIGSLTTGAAILAQQRDTAQEEPHPSPPATPVASAPDRVDRPSEAALDELQGAWINVSTEIAGRKTTWGEFYGDDGPWLVVKGNKFIFIGWDGSTTAPEVAAPDPTRTPRAIDLTPTGDTFKGETYPGIYELEGDRLTLCLSVKPGSERPTEFTSDPDEPMIVLHEFERRRPSR